MKALVTGASGFVGGAVVRRLREHGWEVVGVGRRPLREHGYVSADLSHPLNLDFRPDVVIHAAARSSPWGRKSDFHAQNVEATRNVTDFCATHDRPHLIYISTAAVLYRDEDQLAMDEHTPVPARHVNEYARTKYLGEVIVRSYPGDWCIMRPRAVFGPGDTVVFPRILRALERRRLPLIEAGQPVMGDLVFIDTLAEYIRKAAAQRATGLYHIANAEPVEIYAFLRRICAGLNLPPPQRPVKAARALRLAGWVEAVYRLLPFLGEPPITRFGVGVFAYSKTFDVRRALRDFGPPLVSVGEGLRRFIAAQRVPADPISAELLPLP